MRIIHGIPESLQESAFQLYLNEFKRHNLNLPISELKLIKLLRLSLNWQFVFAAVDGDRVIGLAGYQLSSGSFTGATTPIRLLCCLGIRDFLVLSRSCIGRYRKAQPSELLHDGLLVTSDYRRQGVATHLLGALEKFAKSQSFEQMRLDVMTHNTGAIKLYKKIGYQACSKNTDNYWVCRRYLQLSDK
jgi:ribosomal protein S18 acetylase RimI-like enzyme